MRTSNVFAPFSLSSKVLLILLGLYFLTLMGCVTVHPQALPPQRTKSELINILDGKPDKIVTSKEQSLPHSADEEWIFKVHSGEEHYYFKGETLIAVDLLIYETL